MFNAELPRMGQANMCKVFWPEVGYIKQVFWCNSVTKPLFIN